GRMRLLRKHKDSWSLASMIPALFVLGLLAGPLASYFSTPLRWAFAAALCLYAALVGFVSLLIALRRGNLFLLGWLPLVFLTIHVACGWGFLLEAVLGISPARRGS